MKDCLKHLETYGIDKLDTVTLRYVRDFARSRIKADKFVRDTLFNAGQLAKWDEWFAQDTVNNNLAIDMVNAELNRRRDAQ